MFAFDEPSLNVEEHTIDVSKGTEHVNMKKDNEEEFSHYIAISHLETLKQNVYEVSELSWIYCGRMLEIRFSEPKNLKLEIHVDKNRATIDYRNKPSDFYLTPEGRIPMFPTKEKLKDAGRCLAVNVIRTTQNDYDRYLSCIDTGKDTIAINVLVYHAWLVHEKKMVTDVHYARTNFQFKRGSGSCSRQVLGYSYSDKTCYNSSFEFGNGYY
jgi:hypothetical protein